MPPKQQAPQRQPPQPPQRIRTWPAILTLFWLSPIIAEVMSGSTPPLAFLSPFSLIVLPTFYGSGALLVREIVRRRGWGWPNIVVLGMAYGILEEGIQVQTWFNSSPVSPSASYHHYGELFSINWLWAINLTMYHAVISITIPIILTEALFPRVAARPWLRRRGIVGFSLLLALNTVLVGLLAGFVFSAKVGYAHPPLLPFIFTLGLLVDVFMIGSTVHISLARMLPVAPGKRRAPHLWTVRIVMFLLATSLFLLTPLFGGLRVPGWIAALIILSGYEFAILRVYTWSQRPGWNERHLIALAIGILCFFIFIFAPILEFADHNRVDIGLVPFDLVLLALLIALAWRAPRRVLATALPDIPL